MEDLNDYVKMKRSISCICFLLGRDPGMAPKGGAGWLAPCGWRLALDRWAASIDAFRSVPKDLAEARWGQHGGGERGGTTV